MSLFIAKIDFRDEFPDLDVDDFLSLLPLPHKGVQKIKKKNVSCLIFDYNVALEKPLRVIDDNSVLIQGYSGEDIYARVSSSINAGSWIESRFPESFCGLLIKDGELHAYVSETGVEQIFYIRSNNCLYASNWKNLLRDFIDEDFNKDSFMWMAGRHHIGDHSTYWKNLSRLPPYSLISAKNDSINLVKSCAHLTYGISDGKDFDQLIVQTEDYFHDIFNGFDRPATLWLSGGKDSRAILSLMLRSGVNKDSISLYTSGEPYYPDAMAARNISKYLGMEAQHNFSKSSPIQSSYKYISRLADDLLLDSVGSSMADLKSFSNSEKLIVGGHENGYKDKFNYLNLNDYVQGRKYWVDANNILSGECFEYMSLKYMHDLSNLLQDVNSAKYKQVELIYFRNSTYLSSNISLGHAGVSEFHPFLDGKLVELLLRCPENYTDAQYIHYYLTTLYAKGLAHLPFANDHWPSGLRAITPDFARKSLINSLPYKFLKEFPDLKSFGMFNWRLDLFEISKKFTLNYLHSNDTFFDFLNFDKVDYILGKSSSELSYGEMYSSLALLKCSLVHYFNKKILSFANKDDLINEICFLFGYDNSGSGQAISSADEIINVYKSRVDSLEISVKDLVELQRVSRLSADDFLNDKGIYDELINSSISNEVVVRNFVSKGYEYLSDRIYLDSIKNLKLSEVFVTFEVLGSPDDFNKLLIGLDFGSKSAPVGFESSSSGFYFKYVGELNNFINIKIMLTDDFIDTSKLFIMPWYNSKPIFIRNIVIHEKNPI